MKRKRLILTKMLLACVAAVVVPNRRSLCFALAYDKTQTSEGVLYFVSRV